MNHLSINKKHVMELRVYESIYIKVQEVINI